MSFKVWFRVKDNPSLLIYLFIICLENCIQWPVSLSEPITSENVSFGLDEQ